LSARLGSIVFAKEISDFLYRIIVSGILPHGRLGGVANIILPPLIYGDKLIFHGKEDIYIEEPIQSRPQVER